MEGWTGRVDPGPDALRWHQVVAPVGDDGPPGLALLGLASDEGVRRNGGRPGATQGPGALRMALSNLPAPPGLPLYDAGDITCDDGDLEQAQQRFAVQGARLLDAGHFLTGLGGGHEIGYASYLALARHLQAAPERRVAIVNIDAHLDLRTGPISTSGTPFLQAITHARGRGRPLDYICLGASEAANTAALFRTASTTGTRILLDRELSLYRLPERITQLRSWLEPADAIYLSICLDVLPQAVAPGVSAPSGFGVTLEVVEALATAVVGTGRVKLCDLAELSPPHDRDGATARVAARLMHAITRNLRRSKA